MSSRRIKAAIAAEVAALKRQDGSYAPQDLVEFAKDETTDLHNAFEWDDSVAGHEYRLLQARQLLKVYAVNYDNPAKPEQPISVPLLRGGDEGSYLSQSAVGDREDYRLSVLDEVTSKLISMRDTYEPILPELKPVWRSVKRACKTSD